MTEILIVTVNPAIDVATSTEHVEPDRKLRCGTARVDPGGGGINVARTITKFGEMQRRSLRLVVQPESS